MKTFLSAAFVTFAAAGSALASGPVAPPPPPQIVTIAPSYNWTGFYAGASAGVHSGEMFDIGGPYDVEGYTGALFAGYRHDFGRAVLGAEISTSVGTNARQSAFPNWHFNRFTDVRMTAGYNAGRVLPYFAVGYTFSDFRAGGFGDQGYDGMNAAIGVDVMVNDSLFVGAEINRRWLESDSVAGWTGDINTFQVRVGWRF
ncbi:outer membrane beta-barrel protein [Pararhodobacter sp. CCB-MM2]|uniref:outer membrane beta-barrel protein n=1 Tax=Pararhodobacter sp. CCB-MM2 TaxID=1786003 RepID=UPI0008308DDF|nr:outer membrane beta-barrel protein [Pararhodobacter sp. CCB-MM2]MCA2010162.1 porin family protein [Cereibacter sphaeroides]